jgi:type IV secretion system T-DNA border endonuclease VirD2
MPFGEHEEELWEAMKPRFRPRLVSDPNARYVRNQVRGTGVAAIPAALRAIDRSARATLARVVRRTPEVLVKVTGRKKGAEHLAAHLNYIGRKGEIPLETRDGELISGKGEAKQIAEEWSEALAWRRGATVSAVSMVFSMPAGTDPETVKQAVRETAERLIGDNHDYLMALHTDTPRPHVHLTVQAEGLNHKRFDPRREDLFRFREGFAEALRSRGFEAEASPLYNRWMGSAVF